MFGPESGARANVEKPGIGQSRQTHACSRRASSGRISRTPPDFDRSTQRGAPPIPVISPARRPEGTVQSMRSRSPLTFRRRRVNASTQPFRARAEFLAHMLEFLLLRRGQFGGDFGVHAVNQAGQVPKVLLPQTPPLILRAQKDRTDSLRLLSREPEFILVAVHRPLGKSRTLVVTEFSV